VGRGVGGKIRGMQEGGGREEEADSELSSIKAKSDSADQQEISEPI